MIAAAEAARIKKKREMQKANSQPVSFKESMAKEASKQKKINKRSKAEENEALCEMLGRNC